MDARKGVFFRVILPFAHHVAAHDKTLGLSHGRGFCRAVQFVPIAVGDALKMAYAVVVVFHGVAGGELNAFLARCAIVGLHIPFDIIEQIIIWTE